MARIILFLGLLLMGITSVYAQNNKYPILETRPFGRIVYTYNGTPIYDDQILIKTKIFPDAYKEMKRSKTNRTFGSAFSFTGGFLIGWPLATAIGGGDAQWKLAALGAGVIALGIPFYIAAPRRRKKAIKLYNSHISKPTAQQVEFGFGANNYGIALSMKF